MQKKSDNNVKKIEYNKIHYIQKKVWLKPDENEKLEKYLKKNNLILKDHILNNIKEGE